MFVCVFLLCSVGLNGPGARVMKNCTSIYELDSIAKHLFFGLHNRTDLDFITTTTKHKRKKNEMKSNSLRFDCFDYGGSV